MCVHRVSDASGSLEVTEVGEKPLKRDQLDSNVSRLHTLLPRSACLQSHLGVRGTRGPLPNRVFTCDRRIDTFVVTLSVVLSYVVSA